MKVILIPTLLVMLIGSLQAGTEADYTQLQLAIQNNSLIQVQQLLNSSFAHASDDELGSFLDIALRDRSKDEPVLVEIINHMHTIKPDQFQKAAHLGFLHAIDAMLAKVANKRDALTKALTEALRNSKTFGEDISQLDKTAHYLIDRGASFTIEEFNRVLNFSQDIELIKKMRSKIPDINATNSQGESVLINAVNGRNIDIINYLLDQGASPNIKIEGVPLLAGLIFLYYQFPPEPNIEQFFQLPAEEIRTLRDVIFATIEELLKRRAVVDDAVKKIVSGDPLKMEAVLKGTKFLGGPFGQLEVADPIKINQIRVLLQKYAKK